jgi:hypothetical protein
MCDRCARPYAITDRLTGQYIGGLRIRGSLQGKHYATREAAQRVADRMDSEYGAVRYIVTRSLCLTGM